MQPSAVLSGKVTDKDGTPLSGIIVAVGSRHSTNYDVTMDDGVFVLDTGLKTGSPPSLRIQAGGGKCKQAPGLI